MATVKQLYEDMLRYVRREQVPHLHLRDFSTFANAAVDLIIKDMYLAFEKNQPVLDYLRPIKKTVLVNTLLPGELPNSIVFDLPDDYRHFLLGEVNYLVSQPIAEACYLPGERFSYGTKRLDSDTDGSILSDPYLRPRYFNPYHSIFGNRCFIRIGVQPGLQVESVRFDYLKAPKRIVLTQTQYESDTEDTSDALEWDAPMTQIILNRLIQIVMERDSNPRIASFVPVQGLQPRAETMPGTQATQ